MIVYHEIKGNGRSLAIPKLLTALVMKVLIDAATGKFKLIKWKNFVVKLINSILIWDIQYWVFRLFIVDSIWNKVLDVGERKRLIFGSFFSDAAQVTDRFSRARVNDIRSLSARRSRVIFTDSRDLCKFVLSGYALLGMS